MRKSIYLYKNPINRTPEETKIHHGDTFTSQTLYNGNKTVKLFYPYDLKTNLYLEIYITLPKKWF